MNLLKKAAVALLAGAMALSVAACSTSDTSWGAKYKDETMAAGVYILNQIDAYYDAYNTHMQTLNENLKEGEELPDLKMKDVLSAQIDGKDGRTHISDKTIELIRNYFVINEEFKSRGLSLNEAEVAMLSSNTEMVWSYTGEFYDKNGVSKESANIMSNIYYMSDRIFANRYSESGESAVPEDEIKKHYEDTRARVRYIKFPLVDESGMMPLPEDKLKEVEKQANDYLARAKGGEDFLALMNEYEKSLTPEGTEPVKFTADNADQVIEKSAESHLARELGNASQDEVKLYKDKDNAYYLGMRLETMGNARDYEESKLKLLKEMREDDFNAWLKTRGEEIANDIVINEAAANRYKVDKLKMDTAV